jgi:hypothetical protein
LHGRSIHKKDGTPASVLIACASQVLPVPGTFQQQTVERLTTASSKSARRAAASRSLRLSLWLPTIFEAHAFIVTSATDQKNRAKLNITKLVATSAEAVRHRPQLSASRWHRTAQR